MNVSVILPSLNPDEKLVSVVDGLISFGFTDIIIIDDGSDDLHSEPFFTVSQYKQCTVLRHDVNKGKGRALKTGFSFFIENRENLNGVITVDGDNQHKAEDIYKCAQAMLERKTEVILGVRDFSSGNVPFRSRLGNTMTSFVFKVACGISLSDTQTGLRAIPREYLNIFLETEGERFEYETNMLLQMETKHIKFHEVKIETVYIEDNKTSHFNPIVDSIKIYSQIARFSISAAASSIIDLAAFTVVLKIISLADGKKLSIIFATIIARIISSVFNYNFNARKVFKTGGTTKSSLVRYYSLCVCQMLLSAGLVYLLSNALLWNGIMVTIIKVIVDTALFFVSFHIQKKWVFRTT